MKTCHGYVIKRLEASTVKLLEKIVLEEVSGSSPISQSAFLLEIGVKEFPKLLSREVQRFYSENSLTIIWSLVPGIYFPIVFYLRGKD